MNGINRRRRRGIATIWVAIMLAFTIGLLGLATDTGYVLLTAHRLQNAADAAALAAAVMVRDDQDAGRQAAINVALANVAAGDAVQLARNEGNDPDGDIVLGRYDRDVGTFTPTTTSPNAVRVTARRTDQSAGGPVGTIFGRVFGIHTVNVTRTAVAMIGGSTGAGLIALDRFAAASLEVRGTVRLDVDGGAIQVNSLHVEAVDCKGNPEIIAPDLNVCGDIQFIGNARFEGELHTGAPPIQDPLAFLPEVTWDEGDDRGAVSLNSGVSVVEPGYYSGGIKATGGDLILRPGIYIVDGEGFNISGNTNLLAEGVMLYVTGSGKVDLTGTGTISITPPDPDEYSYPDVGVYEGVSIFQDRSNTSEARIIGTSGLDLDGTLYFAKANVNVSGTGDGFGQQLIGNTVEVGGTGEIHINYDGRFPAPGTHVFLVE